MIGFLFINNSLDVFVDNFRQAVDDALISGANLRFSIYPVTDAGVRGTVIASATSVSMTELAAGQYRGTAGNLGLTEASRYEIVVTSTSLECEFSQTFIARQRGFRSPN